MPLRLTIRHAQQIVAERARVSDNVVITDHAAERMDERGITLDDVLVILRKAAIYVAPKRNEHAEWQVEVERRMPGGREAAVVTVIPDGIFLIVRTVMWRDER